MYADLVCGHISQQEYRVVIEQIISLLEGKNEDIIKQLEQEINEKAEKLEFENAAILRDRKIAIENLMQRQKISNISENDIDVIGLYRQDEFVCIQIFFIRNSKMIGRENFFIKQPIDIMDNEIISSFIKQYYIDKLELPNKIMIRYDLHDAEAIEKWLSEKAGRRVELKVPQKGQKVRFIDMAENNSKIYLMNELNKKYDTVLELKKVLNMSKMPKKIECYDISNISGTNIVAGMVVLLNGKIRKNMSRKFKIKNVFNQDDPRCMQEVIERRLLHTLEEKDEAFGELPDVIFVDGGITQIRAAYKSIDKYNLDIQVFGMVKNDKHRTEKLINREKIEIQLNEKLKNLITNLQDEVHKVAITYHKKLRDKQMTKSKLDEIKGIGDRKRQELLKTFGSIENIQRASIDEISKVKGIGVNLANIIKEKLM